MKTNSVSKADALGKAHIPSRESWTFQNPKVYESLKRGLQQAHEGKVTKVKDVEKFLDML